VIFQSSFSDRHPCGDNCQLSKSFGSISKSAEFILPRYLDAHKKSGLFGNFKKLRNV
jgi:hypothetical protein